LHCDGSSEWEKAFLSLVSCLTKPECLPDLVVITGDLVDNPFTKNYQSLVRQIAFLKSTIDKIRTDKKIADPLHILAIPGNHDYSLLGNRVIMSKRLYNKALPQLLSPQNSIDKVIESFFIKNKIAIFPLDSNSSKSFVSFAQGHVDDPLMTLKGLDDYFRQVAKTNSITNYGMCPKIVLLHHHPLPVRTPADDERLEPFMLLLNSYEFLQAVTQYNVSLILHGHKHVSGVSQFKFLSPSKSSVIISSCGTTCHLPGKNREVKVIELTDSGTCSIQSYRTDGDTEFTPRANMSELLISYGDVRKINYKNKELVIGFDQNPIARVESKKKIVWILEDGRAMINLAHEHIKWKPDIKPPARKITELLLGDNGRIVHGQYEFGPYPLWKPNSPVNWFHPAFGDDYISDYPLPDAPEQFRLCFPVSVSIERAECCQIGYSLLNGFTLNEREHKESYDSWPGRLAREEITFIDANYRTDFLQLIVNFPHKACFPNPESFRLEAILRPKDEKLPDLLRQKGTIHEEETTFLREKGAIKIHPELNTVELLVKYPQPNLIYVLRWTVPKCADSIILPQSYNRKLNILQEEILDPSSSATDNFYREVKDFLKNQLFKDDNIKIFLFGYDRFRALLNVTRHPKELIPQHKLKVGRGPAGKAFKLREVVCWDKADEIKATMGKPVQTIEQVISSLDPVAVACFPVLYPKHSQKDWQYIIANSEESKKKICPAFAVFSVATTQDTVSFLRLIKNMVHPGTLWVMD
jgi:predicted MPP superfamily phosphohydrolase